MWAAPIVTLVDLVGAMLDRTPAIVTATPAPAQLAVERVEHLGIDLAADLRQRRQAAGQHRTQAALARALISDVTINPIRPVLGNRDDPRARSTAV